MYTGTKFIKGMRACYDKRTISLSTILLFFLVSCSPQVDLIPTITKSPTVTSTSTNTPRPSETPSPTNTPKPLPTPTPLGAGKLIYAYITENSETSEIHVVKDTISLSFQFDGVTTDGIRAGNMVKISPDGSKIVVELLRENQTQIVLLDIQENRLTSKILDNLPINNHASALGFSKSGKWLFVKYYVGRNSPRTRIYNLDDGGFIQLNHCKGIYGFSIDEIYVYCRTNSVSNVPKPIQYNLITHVESSFFYIPKGKQWQVNKLLLYPKAFIFERNQAILNGGIIVDNLNEIGNRSYWSADDIRGLLSLPVYPVLSLGENFLPEPNGERIALYGTRGGYGSFDLTCIPPNSYTLLSSMEIDFEEEGIAQKILNNIYPFSWSPDGTLIVGLVYENYNSCRLSIFNAETLEETVVILQGLENSVRYWFRQPSGIDAVWVP